MKRVTAELESAILRHGLVDQWPVGTIATQLGVHHDVVRRCLRQHGMLVPAHVRRARMVDAYVDFIADTLNKYPRLHASRLYQMVQERGYQGSESHFRRMVAELRPAPVHEPFLRLCKLPAEEAQVDWASFGTVVVGRATRKLYAFVMTLSWSKMAWLQFFFDMQMANFLRGHVDALRFYGGVPRKLLYDNLKSAVLEREGQAIRFNPRLLELANHYRFEPRAAAPRRGNEKGVVERTIRYVRSNFFAARDFHDIDRLNDEAHAWCTQVSTARRWPQDDTRLVGDVFAEERPKLRELPADDFPAHERKTVKVGRTPWVRFDKNDYSVPAKYVRRPLDVLADHRHIRIVADGHVVAEHVRSFDRRATVENPAHTAALLALKRQARKANATSRLLSQAAAAGLFLERAALRGHNLGSLTSRLMTLLDVHGGAELHAALSEVNVRDVVNVNTVRLVLEQRARAAGRKVLMPVRFSRPELAQLSVRVPDLSTYDKLTNSDDDEEPSDG